MVEFPALIDTGTPGTLITQEAADTIGISGIAPAYISPAGGEEITTERVRFLISLKHQSTKPWRDGKGYLSRPVLMDRAAIHPPTTKPPVYSVLVGMDYIQHCTLIVDAGRFLFLPAGEVTLTY